MAIGNLAL